MCTHRCGKDFEGRCWESQANATGHYTCTVRRKGEWWHLDDNKPPTPKNETSVQQQLQETNRKGAYPYLLWYQRTESAAPSNKRPARDERDEEEEEEDGRERRDESEVDPEENNGTTNVRPNNPDGRTRPHTRPESMEDSDEDEDEEKARRRARTNHKDTGISKRLKSASRERDQLKIPGRKWNPMDKTPRTADIEGRVDKRRGETNFPLQLPGEGRRNPPDNRQRAETMKADAIIEGAKKKIK